MFKNLFKKSYTSINTNDHGSAGVSRAESAKADKRAAEAAQEKPEKIPSRPTAMTPESLRSLWRKCNKCEKPILVAGCQGQPVCVPALWRIFPDACVPPD